MDIQRATDVFCGGFATTRSRTHPYEVVQLGGLRVLRDTPRKRGPYRGEEVISCGLSPEETMAQLAGFEGGAWSLCVIWEQRQDIEAESLAYKAAGFRQIGTEGFFAQSGLVRPCRCEYEVRLVRTEEDALAVKKADGHYLVRRPDLIAEVPVTRLFAAFDGKTPVGWVRSVRVTSTETWVAGLYVPREFRRRGIGRALMTTMLADDRARGYTDSVLLASTVGALLYPGVGYDRIGTLRLFKPPKG